MRRHNPAVFNPAVIGYELTQKLDATQARQVLDGLSGSEVSRRDVIGRLWTTEATRSLAEALADPDVDGAGMAQVIECPSGCSCAPNDNRPTQWGLPMRQGEEAVGPAPLQPQSRAWRT